jgi:hypothetical protein
MNKLSSLLLAGGIALAVAGVSSPALAGPAEDSIAQLDKALSGTPVGGTAQFYTAKASAVALRNQAAAELIAGREQSAEQIAQLALHQLGSDGIAGGETVANLGMVGGGWPSNQPAVPATELSGGATSPVHVAIAGQATRFVSE